MREITDSSVFVPEKNDARPYCQHSTTETISVRIGDYEINARCTRYELEDALKQLKRLDDALSYIGTLLDIVGSLPIEKLAPINKVIHRDYLRAMGRDVGNPLRPASTQDRIDCALAVIDELEHFLKTDPVTGIHMAKE